MRGEMARTRSFFLRWDSGLYCVRQALRANCAVSTIDKCGLAVAEGVAAFDSLFLEGEVGVRCSLSRRKVRCYSKESGVSRYM